MADLTIFFVSFFSRPNIEKIIKKSKANKNNIAYGNYLLSKYEQKTKNYEKELNFLIKGHQLYFDSRKAKFEIMLKYNFDNMLQIVNGVEVKKLNGIVTHLLKADRSPNNQSD